jgi:hypothetical protein
MTPVPPEKTPVRLALAPELMEAGLAVKLVMVGAGPVIVLLEPPQAATHRQTAETVARVASRSKNFIFMPPKPHSRWFANGTSLPDDSAGSCWCLIRAINTLANPKAARKIALVEGSSVYTCCPMAKKSGSQALPAMRTVNVADLTLSNPQNIQPVYSNNASVTFSPHDLRITFSEIVTGATLNTDPSMELRANVVMTPTQFKALLDAMQNTFNMFNGPLVRSNGHQEKKQ